LETEPQPARSKNIPVKRRRVMVRTKSSLELSFQLRRGTYR
jgi:hypothetical protein